MQTKRLYIWCKNQADSSRPGLGQSLKPVILHAEVILTFIFMCSLMASALDSQLSGGCSKLMREGSQCQPIRKKLLLSKRQCEFQVLVTPSEDAGVESTEEVVTASFSLGTQTEGRKEGSVSHTSNLEPFLTLLKLFLSPSLQKPKKIPAPAPHPS